MKPTFKLPVVPELELYAEVLRAKQRHRILKVVLRGRRYAHLIALNGRLHFLELRVLDRRRHLFRGVTIECHLELDLPRDLVATGGFDVPDVEIFHRNAALYQLRLKYVEERVHPVLALRRQVERSLDPLEFDSRHRSLE